MLADLQSVSTAARYAAIASADGAADARMAASIAALQAGEAYRGVTEFAIHLFGGIGFTWEHDAYLLTAARGRPSSWPAARTRTGPLWVHRGPIRSGGAGRWLVGTGAQ